MAAAAAGFRAWSQTTRRSARRLSRPMADRLEREAPRFLSLLQIEGGKTLDDAVAELREAVDYCRYYAALARRLFAVPEACPARQARAIGLRLWGAASFSASARGIFRSRSFLGRSPRRSFAATASLPNPREQTPLIAAEAVRAFHRAGVPVSALHLMLGDGNIGAALVDDPHVAGVVFTGSTEVAWHINRALAAKAGPIVPLIAETGGINAMIVDATALPEQVTDDVITSAFRSTGQRCSALRLLCLQEDVADADARDDRRRGARIGDRRSARSCDPYRPGHRPSWQKRRSNPPSSKPRRGASDLRRRTPASARQGFYVAPHIFELAGSDLDRRFSGRFSMSSATRPTVSTRFSMPSTHWATA